MRQETTYMTRFKLLMLFFLLTIAAAVDGAAVHGEAADGQPAISPQEAIEIATMREIGAEDFRVSDAGRETDFIARGAAVAFNPDANEYLVVWEAIDVIEGTVVVEHEIFGQRLDADTGEEVGPNDFRISVTGPGGDAAFTVSFPSVVYNPIARQYLVVWQGNADHTATPLKTEIYGIHLNDTGAPLSAAPLRISYTSTASAGPPRTLGAPAVAFNPRLNEYLVAWKSTTGVRAQVVKPDGSESPTSSFLVSNSNSFGNVSVAYNLQLEEYFIVWEDDRILATRESEIFGQRLNRLGQEVGLDDIRITHMGPGGAAEFYAVGPAVHYHPENNTYLVVWTGVARLENQGRPEVFGQILASNGLAGGVEPFLISERSENGETLFQASQVDLTYDGGGDRFLVTWQVRKPSEELEDTEIVGRFVTGDGAVNGDTLRISLFGQLGLEDPEEIEDFSAGGAAVIFNPTASEFLVSYQGNDDQPLLTKREVEVYAQLLNADGERLANDDIRLSDAGRDLIADARRPRVAYNSQDHEYLVVWEADGNEGMPNNDFEIWGQRIDAATGAELGDNDFRISQMGPEGDGRFAAEFPTVAYNSRSNEYLVVWQADHNLDGQVDGEVEIFARRLGADGRLISAVERISRMGLTGNFEFGAFEPEVVYNPINDQYLVIWWGNHAGDGLHPFELEVFGQLMGPAVDPEGGMIRLSHVGIPASDLFNVFGVSLAHNTRLNQYLVVWESNDNRNGLALTEREIYGRLFDNELNALGADHFRMSQVGPDGDSTMSPREVAATYNAAQNQYLVVWEANDTNAGIHPQKTEVFGQLLDAEGREIGLNDFQISRTGDADDPNLDANNPDVIYEAAKDQYLVVWSALNIFSGERSEHEIAWQLLEADGSRVFEKDVRLSQMGADGESGFGAGNAAPSCAGELRSCLVVWSGNDNRGTLTGDETEIFAQMLGANSAPVAQPDSYAIAPDTVLSVDAPGVLANDEDADGDVLTVVFAEEPANGELTLLVNGGFFYVPAAGFTGTDTFTYRASDGLAESEVATVTIVVAEEGGDPDPEPEPEPEPDPLTNQVFLPAWVR